VALALSGSHRAPEEACQEGKTHLSLRGVLPQGFPSSWWHYRVSQRACMLEDQVPGRSHQSRSGELQQGGSNESNHSLQQALLQLI
jgi:hypothetical protein